MSPKDGMRLFSHLRAAFRPDGIHQEISDELQFHLEMKTAELMQNGVPEAQARIDALKAVGKLQRIQEEGYDVRGGLAADLSGDIRFAFRLLRKRWLKTIVLAAILALGLGVNASVFGVVRSTLLRPLSFPNSDQLLVMHQTNHGQNSGVSYPNFEDWRARNRSFADMAVYLATSATLSGQGRATTVSGAIVSSALFRVLRVQPLRGRLFRDAEDTFVSGAGTLSPVLLSERLWRSRFGQRTDILGKTVHLDGRTFEVIGVIPAKFAYPLQAEPIEYWITVAVDADPALYGGSIPTSRGYPRYDGAIGRLRPGITMAQANSDMARVAGLIAKEHPKATSSNEIAVNSALEEITGGSNRTMTMLLFGAVFCVLAVACVNLANILLVDAISRRREFALRRALGAPTFKLIRQLLVETILVALAGGIASLPVAWLALRVFVAVAPPDTPRLAEIRLDGSVLGYVLVLSVLIGTISGCIPALAIRRYDLVESLKEGARSLTKRSSAWRAGPVLICGQIAIGMVLTCSAAVLVTSFQRILHESRGFNPHGVLTASISLPTAKYGQGSTKVSNFYRELLLNMRALPGVQSAGIAEVLPLSGQSNSTEVKIVGATESGKPSTDLRFVDPAYFGLLQIPLVNGRLFDERDLPGRMACAIVNQAFVRRFLQGKDPLESKLQLGWGGEKPKEIVGVVGDIRHSATSATAVPEVYIPVAQFPLNDMAILVRGDESRMADSLRSVVARLDSAVPLDRVRTLDAYLLLASAPQQFLMWLLFAFASTALLLAAAGLYGVLSDSIGQRSHEFGVRLALGASRWQVMKLVLGQGLAVACAGVAAGAILTSFTSRLLVHWLYETQRGDFRLFAVSAAILLLVAMSACLAPSWRAACTDPAVNLRAAS